MKIQELKNKRRERTVHRVRARISGTATKPRVAITRSLKHLAAQFIDDQSGKTLVAISDKELTVKGTKTEIATELGKAAAKKALDAGIKQVVLDRRWYKFHGRVKAFADGLREGGIQV